MEPSLPERIESALVRLLDGSDAEFHAGVERLRAEHPDLDHRIVRHAASILAAGRRATLPPAAAADEYDLRPGDLVGSLVVQEPIGQGGMGSVWIAEQQEPVRRRVALKVVKLGMDTRSVLARFEVERRTLALMDHDHIARVFDAGVTPQGRPYFTMEYVPGLPITRYCDANTLGLDDRFRLFLQVCSGVQHAHAKGVIHRDLTANNVLVTDQGGQPVVKIIDFGLARAIDRSGTAKSLFTERGMILGTPEYMSPEQAGLGELDVDIRSDVYTLGVLLYELVTGCLPFDSRTLRAAGYEAMCRTIREQEPPRPSTRVTTAVGGIAAAARLRDTDSGALLRRLRGDLDWIVLECLEKDRGRRYPTVGHLADDLQRHLADQPVVARPPSAGYRLAKFARRHRGRLIAAGLVLLALVVGLVSTTVFLLRAHARQREFDQLAGLVLHERAVAEEGNLYPPWPAQIDAIRHWLARAADLLALRPTVTQSIVNLRGLARLETEAERQRRREAHARHGEWRTQSARLEALVRAQAVRAGAEPLLQAPSEEEQALGVTELHERAWPLVDSDPATRVFGEEARGLALAQLAWDKAQASPASTRAWIGETLAWAWHAIGKDDAALAQSAANLALAPADEKPNYEMYSRILRRRVAAAQSPREGEAELAALRTVVARLGETVDSSRTFHSGDEAHAFLHDALCDLLARLDTLDARERPDVQRRLVWAERIEALTRAHPHAPASWESARAAIAAADGVGASTRYRAVPIDLTPQLGLVPIGMNPATGLWEFYELRSAWDGSSDPAGIAIPHHVGSGDHEGDITVTEETGIVFVLLPGGDATIGAQAADPAAPRHDPEAQADESLRRARLAPFFLGRHELTQAQWRRLTGSNPSYYPPGAAPKAVRTVVWTNPVEQLDWFDADRWLTRHGLALPTEAQWEYACRSGTDTPWSCPRDDLVRHANLADATAARHTPNWPPEAWDDGYLVHAPVGTYRPNAFGLFDMHGNVAEWTRDGNFDAAAGLRDGDGWRGEPTTDDRVLRGGGFSGNARAARSAERIRYAAAQRGLDHGLRAARALLP